MSLFTEEEILDENGKPLTPQEKLARRLEEEIRVLLDLMTISEKLEIYGLSQQAKHGDVDTPQPIRLWVRERAKWDAWNKLKGMPQKEAKEQFLMRALELKDKYGS